MNRTGLLIALGLAALVGIVFALWPELDLRIARPYYETFVDPNYFALRVSPLILNLRESAMWLLTLMLVPPVVALVLKLILPRRPLLISARAILFLIVTMTFAPGIAANLVLKDHWGRPRPIDVAQYGGAEHFVPWWDPRGDCPNNCSFISGDVSAAAWTFAPAALAPAPLRPFAYAAAFAFSAGVGWLRMAMGGHFFTDVVFAGVVTFLIVWLAHGLIYRWPRTRLSDETLERALERLAMPGYEAIRGLFAGKRTDQKM